MNKIRPPEYWNFFEDGPADNRVKHVLRYDANPAKCYEDGRIDVILDNIQEIGQNLQRYQEQIWKTLRKQTLEIFH